MSQFKTVVESFQSSLKTVSDGIQQVRSDMNAEFSQLRSEMNTEFRIVKQDINYLKNKSDTLTVQVALLHEGQTEIKNGLKQKVDHEEFTNLEKRVAKLESKVA